MELLPRTSTVKTSPEQFIGGVYVNAVKTQQGVSRLNAHRVRFTPGSRNNWHSHALGQTLVGVDGRGVVVDRYGLAIPIGPGDVVWTPPGEEHWHGATADCMRRHYALYEGDEEGDASTWLEPVSEEHYAAALQNSAVLPQ